MASATVHRSSWESLGVAWNGGRDEFEFPDLGGDTDAAGLSLKGQGGGSSQAPRRAHGVLVAVAAIVLLATGIAVGGIEEPTPSPPSSVAPACAPVATDTVPPFALRAAGSALGFGGTAGYSRRPGFEDPGDGWQVPDPDPGRTVPEIPSGASVELAAADGICFTFIDAEFAAANLDSPPGRAERRPLMAEAVEPPAPHPGIGVLPDGDWVVRVSATFDTGAGGPGGLVTGERYFRIRVGSGPIAIPTPTPEPRPLVTPAVACGPAPVAADAAEIVMIVPGSQPVPGVAPGTTVPVVEIPLAERASLAVSGDACALRWTIDIRNAANGERYRRDIIRNPEGDPHRISQNRWQLAPVIGSYDVIAELNFGPGVDVVRTWRIIGAAFSIPDTFLVADDGRRVRAAPSCGVSFTLASGYAGGDEVEVCTGFLGDWDWGSPGEPTGLTRSDLPLLRVRAWSPITLEIPGWTITSWNGACGRIEAGEDGVERFEARECWLGGYSVVGSGGATPPAPAQFLARPGDLVVRLTVTAAGRTGQYTAQMFARIIGR